MFTDRSITKVISHAILSHTSHMTTTLLLLPLYTTPIPVQHKKQKLRNEYNTLLKHPSLLPLVMWNPNTLPLNNGNKEEDLVYEQHHIALFVTASQYPPTPTLSQLKRRLHETPHLNAAKVLMSKTQIQYDNSDMDTLLKKYNERYKTLPIENLPPPDKKYTQPIDISRLDMVYSLVNMKTDDSTIKDIIVSNP